MAKNPLNLDDLLGDDDDIENQNGPEDDEEVGGEEGADTEDDGEEADDDEGSDEEEALDVAPQQSRRQKAVRSLRKRAQEAERKAAGYEDLERRYKELEQRVNNQQGNQQRQESPEDEATRLALMSPEERLDYKLDKATKGLERQAQRMQFEANDNADRAAFMAMASVDKLAARFAPEVERRLNELKAKGQYAGREVILNFLIGETARKAAKGRTAGKQRRNGRVAVERERISTGGARSDVASTRGRREKSLEERLEGVKI